ncbi:MAG: uracil phosphoribosyltransferase [bacterium]
MPLVVVDHPLIKHKLTIVRDKETSSKKFREVVNEITLLLTYEATRDLTLDDVEIETPLCRTTQKTLNPSQLVIAPILRAGLGMVQGMLDLIPHAQIAHIGMYRDEKTFKPITYYSSFPVNISQALVIVVDPMLATAGTLVAAVDEIKKLHPRQIRAVSLIAAPEGARNMEAHHPDVTVYTGALDERLNDRAYIVPGLGDAGDRLFGTH